MRLKSKIELNQKLKLHYVSIGKDDLITINEGSEKDLYNQRITIDFKEEVSWKAGTVSLGEGKAYVTISKSRMKILDLALGDTVEFNVEKDHSEFGFDVPEEFTIALEQDSFATQRFNSLTKGKQRALIYLIVQLKTSEKRIDKSLFLLDNIKRAPEGNITMRHILGKDLP